MKKSNKKAPAEPTFISSKPQEESQNIRLNEKGEISVKRMDLGFRFDEQFGKPGPQGDSDSIGEMAGCDDCAYNINLRARHKQFVMEAQLDAYREAFTAARRALENIAYIKDINVARYRLKCLEVLQTEFDNLIK